MNWTDPVIPRDPQDDYAAQVLRRLEARPGLVFGRLRFNLQRSTWPVADALAKIGKAVARSDDFTLAGPK